MRTVYKAKDGEEYIFNLIDTPGHVVNYEVSRSLAACDGAILVVDASRALKQRWQMSYLALDNDLDVFTGYQ